jgi:hypothetical protein
VNLEDQKVGAVRTDDLLFVYTYFTTPGSYEYCRLRTIQMTKSKQLLW